MLLELGRGDLEQDEAPGDLFGVGELINDLIGDIDKFLKIN